MSIPEQAVNLNLTHGLSVRRRNGFEAPVEFLRQMRYRFWEGWIIQNLDGTLDVAKLRRFLAQIQPVWWKNPSGQWLGEELTAHIIDGMLSTSS
jgi:hypothetical protein